MSVYPGNSMAKRYATSFSYAAKRCRLLNMSKLNQKFETVRLLLPLTEERSVPLKSAGLQSAGVVF
jgi:hypothetical protein